MFAMPGERAAVAQYNNRRFWIADTDIVSKLTFGVVMLLFSILALAVTNPANQ